MYTNESVFENKTMIGSRDGLDSFKYDGSTYLCPYIYIYFPKEASTKPGTQQTLRDCLLNKRMDGRMGGWLDMITGSCR